MSFLYPISVISICPSCTLNGPLPWHNSLTACIDHLEDTGSLSYADHPDVGTFYTIKMSHSLISPPISSEKSGTMWETVKLLTAVSKIFIFACKLKFCHWQQILPLTHLP